MAAVLHALSKRQLCYLPCQRGDRCFCIRVCVPFGLGFSSTTAACWESLARVVKRV